MLYGSVFNLSLTTAIIRMKEKINFRKAEKININRFLEIFNYYIENGNSAYPENIVDESFLLGLFDEIGQYPFYACFYNDLAVGFGFLRKFMKSKEFDRSCVITYFIDHRYTRMGIGNKLLKILENEAKLLNIDTIIAHIIEENIQSIKFHINNGFEKCAYFKNVGRRKNEDFSIVYMMKKI